MHRVVLVCALAVLIPRMALGDEKFRCGSYLISVPLTVEELVKKCGEPTSKKVATDDVRTRVGGGGTRAIGTTTVETWRYDRVPMVVTINDGAIVSIEPGEK